jgi:hypothetical protein
MPRAQRLHHALETPDVSFSITWSTVKLAAF